MSNTSNFTSYNKNGFNYKNQIELSNFRNFISKKGAKVLVGNSYSKNIDEYDNFFENTYSNYKIIRIDANSIINSKGNSRFKIKEILILNF